MGFERLFSRYRDGARGLVAAVTVLVAVSVPRVVGSENGLDSISRKTPRREVEPGAALVLPAVSRPNATPRPKAPGARLELVKGYGALPLSFEPNLGQVDKQVRFLWRGGEYLLFLTEKEAVLALNKPSAVSARPSANPGLKLENRKSAIDNRQLAVLRMQLMGANPAPLVTGLDELPGKSNYFIGSDPAKWLTNIPNYSKVRYESLYSGVDLVYYANARQLECDFVLAPGADPKVIALKFKGPNKLSLSPSGDLRVQTKGGVVVLRKPRAYQPIGGEHRRVQARFVLKAAEQVGFKVSPYDRRLPLVIDPVLSYSTYLGGSGDDRGNGIAIDGAGNAYVTGSTLSADFPTTSGAFNTTFNTTTCPPGRPCQDVFVAKLNAAGTALLYSTYVGGRGDDIATAIAVDSAGNAYVTGNTTSTDFPTTPTAFQTTLRGTNNVFVTKLNSNGSGLVYSTYVGGTRTDMGNAIALDTLGSAYVTGSTTSSDFPITTTNGFQTTFTGSNLTHAFVTKLRPDGTGLLYSTFLEGTDNDQGFGIAVDRSSPPNGLAYVTGSTASPNFPTVGPIQGTKGALNDAFVSKIDTTRSGAASLVYSTFLGGNDNDQGLAIAVDSSGSAYITGVTSSTDFRTVNPLQATIGGGGDAFVAKVNPAGSALTYSTYLGGIGQDSGNGIALDSSGSAYVTGQTTSSNFPTAKPFQANVRRTDAFVAKINAAGSALDYSSFLGGNGTEAGKGIAVDSSGSAYVTGSTDSVDFPTTGGSLQASSRGGSQAFVTKISLADVPGVSLTRTRVPFTDQFVGTTSPPRTVTLRNVGSAPLTVSIAVTGDFSQANDCTTVPGGASCTLTITFSPSVRGLRTGTITITDNAAGSPHLISLSGNGVQPAVTLSATNVTFPDQAVGSTSAPRTVTLTNTGSDPLTILDISIAGDYAQTNNCGTTVAAGGNCSFNITFTPTAAFGRTGTLSITDNAPGSPHQVQLSGRGLGPIVDLSSTSVTFGEQPVGTTSGAQTVTLTNSGNAALTISSITATGAFAQTNNCGATVAAGQKCTLSATFSPRTAGTTFGAITIVDNAPGSPHQVTLTGTAIAGPAPEAFLSSSNVSFGPQRVGSTSSAQVLTLTNTGNAQLTLSSIVASADFSQTNDCGNNVAAGARCSISLTFTPAAAGPRTGTVTITDNATGSPHAAGLLGSGTDFEIGASTTNPPINAGQPATYTLTIAPDAGFNEQVSFACGQLPPATTCAFAPSTVTLNGTSPATSTLTVTTTARSMWAPHGNRPWMPPSGGLIRPPWPLGLFALILFGAAMTHRLGVRRAWLLFAIFLVLVWSACSVGSEPIRGTPPGNYTFTVTATSGTLSHTASLGLTVN